MSETRNPFITLEALMEHLGSAQSSVKKAPKDVGYHVDAAAAAGRRLFQSLALLLPGAYASYEGEPTDTIVDQIERAGAAREEGGG